MENKNVLIALLLVLTSCVIEINESGYKSLTQAEKAKVKSFSEAVNYNSNGNWDDFSIYEIDSDNMRSLLKKQEYSWFHMWVPFCSIESCVNIKPFENLEKEYAHNGLNLTLISTAYRLDKIFEIVKGSKFLKEVYVLKGDYYGVKHKEIRKKLNEDLHPRPQPEDFYFTDYIFKADSLIFIGEVNDSIMSTLF